MVWNERLKKIRKYILACIFTFTHVFVAVIKEDRIFTVDNRYTMGRYWIFRIISVVIVWIIYYLFFKTLEEYNNKKTVAREYVKNFVICLLISVIFFLLVYPGQLMGDHIRNMNQAVHLGLPCGMTFLFPSIYILSYMILPAAVSPILALMLLADAVFSYVITELHELYHKSYVYFLYLTFLLPTTLIATIHPHRLQFYTWLYVYLIFDIWVHYRKGTIEIKNLIFWGLLTGMLAMFRTEGIYLLVLIPIICCLGIKKTERKKVLCLVMCMLISFIFFEYTEKRIENLYLDKNFSEVRSSYITIVPLGLMLDEPDKVTITEEQYQILNKVVDLSTLKDYVNVHDYKKGVNINRDLAKEDYSNYMKCFAKIVMSNPIDYAEIKWRMYIYASAMGDERVDYCGCNIMNSKSLQFEQGKKLPEWREINPQIKKTVLKFVEGHTMDNYMEPTIIYRVFYNTTPLLTIIVLLLFLWLNKRKYLEASVMLTILCHAGLVFMTASVSRFKHYLPVFMLGLVFLMIYIFELIIKKRSENKVNM